MILEVIKSSRRADSEKMKIHCLGVFDRYLGKYERFYLSPTVHKLLIHWLFIVEHNLLPIGELTEEALERRHTHFKSYRTNFARKLSRQLTNVDVFNR